MSLQDAVDVLNAQAEGQPVVDRSQIICTALALQTAALGAFDRDLLDAAAGLEILATGGQLDLDETGRQRAGELAKVVAKLISGKRQYRT